MHIQTRTPFKGDADKAWNMAMDFSQYERWNPFVVKASAAGRELVSICLDPSPEDRMVTLDVKLTKAVAPQRIVGVLKYGPGPFLSGRYDLEIDQAAGAIVQDVKLGGWLRSFYVSDHFGRQVERGLNAMGAALAKRCA